MLNLFRLAGDFSHLLAIIYLPVNIWRGRSAAGISGKSQVLLALVFTARYADIFTNFISVYNSSMKVIFLVLTYLTLFLLFIKFRDSYQANQDTFRAEILVVIAVVLAVRINHEMSIIEILWTFSVYLESVAILPQLYMIALTRAVDTTMSYYLFAMGNYRVLYICNWVVRYFVEGYWDLIAIAAGCVQAALYCSFFFVYATNDLQPQPLQGDPPPPPPTPPLAPPPPPPPPLVPALEQNDDQDH